jgi:hypothetical protein
VKPTFSQNIDRFEQPFLPQRGHDLLADQREIGIRILSVFRGHRMSRQQRWADIDRIILSWRATCSIFSSASAFSPYPDLISRVVTPSFIRR